MAIVLPSQKQLILIPTRNPLSPSPSMMMVGVQLPEALLYLLSRKHNPSTSLRRSREPPRSFPKAVLILWRVLVLRLQKTPSMILMKGPTLWTMIVMIITTQIRNPSLRVILTQSSSSHCVCASIHPLVYLTSLVHAALLTLPHASFIVPEPISL